MDKCRACGGALGEPFLSLGSAPLSNSYLTQEQLSRVEPCYPLDLYLCGTCFLMQLDVFEKAEKIFSQDYAYFSSYSETWLEHCQRYVGMVCDRFRIDKKSFVVEIGSNDGYLLQYFVQRGIPVLGIEPAFQCAFAALKKGVPTEAVYFNPNFARKLVDEGRGADLIVGNNVLPHNPGINDFVAAMRILLKPHGVITMEFGHLLQMVEKVEFDTIYHEHFSYLSFRSTQHLFRANGLELFDVEELPTHGGSLRIYAKHAGDDLHPVTDRVKLLLDKESQHGLFTQAKYLRFAEDVKEIKRKLLTFLIEQTRAGKRIVGYGAPAKGNTILNYCGVRTDFIDYTVDRSPHKQGLFLPGSRIPIFPPEKIYETRPDYVFILPWNIREEVVRQMGGIRKWGGKFFIAIPELTVIQ